jgi:SlyX protein
MATDRIMELEIKVAYQEDLVQELNQIVAQQQLQIDRLETAIKLLNERIRSLSEDIGQVDNKNEKPPHY